MQPICIIIKNLKVVDQNLIIQTGMINFKSCIPITDGSDSLNPVFDDYTLEIKHVCAYIIHEHIQLRYIFDNIDFIEFAEFTNIAMK